MSHWPSYNAHHFESDYPQGWNLTDQPYGPHMNMARGALERSSIVHPPNNTCFQGHFPPQWIPDPVYPSSVHNVELRHYQPMLPQPSHDPFVRQSADGNHHMLQENYSHNHCSSGIPGQIVSGIDGASYQQISGHGRGTYKRKNLGFHDMGSTSTSRYYEVGRSSESQMPTNSWQSAESYHGHWEYPQSHGVNNLAMSGDCLRNVRRRTALDLDHYSVRNHYSNNTLQHSFFNEQFNPVDAWAQSSSSSTRERANHSMPPYGNVVMADSDSSYYNREPGTMSMPNNHRNGIGGFNVVHSMRNPALPPFVNSHLNHPVGGVRIGNCQRSTLSFGSHSSNFCQGYLVPSGGSLISGPSYPVREPQPHTTLRFQNVERNRRISRSDRYRSLNESNFCNHLTAESVAAMGHSGFYRSDALLDQHRDMRLDIDEMTYEELLALGESIGSVSTGLSESLISKCLTESIHCSSDPSQDEGNCVICLEEYEDKDDVGTLTECGHGFHVVCIRKWLSLKNLCPICKATAFDDKTN